MNVIKNHLKKFWIKTSIVVKTKIYIFKKVHGRYMNYHAATGPRFQLMKRVGGFGELVGQENIHQAWSRSEAL